jgi:hypothetical protein
MTIQINPTQREILVNLVENRIEYLRDFEEADVEEMAELKECEALRQILETDFLSPAMIATVFDVLANAEPSQLQVEHSHGDDIVTGQDALELFSQLHNQTSREMDVE